MRVGPHARMSSSTIPTGPYFGFTKAELLAEQQRYKSAVKKSHSNLSSASVNGQSFTYGGRQDGTLAEWQQDLQAALAYFGQADVPAEHAAVSFNASCTSAALPYYPSRVGL